MEELPFDKVVVTEDGADQLLDAHAFLTMSLHRRVRLILERRVSLFLGTQPVKLSQALKSGAVQAALGAVRKR